MRDASKEDAGDGMTDGMTAAEQKCNNDHDHDHDHSHDKSGSSKMADISKAVQALALHDSQSGASAPRTLQDARGRKYKFWDTQPVPKISESFLFYCVFL